MNSTPPYLVPAAAFARVLFVSPRPNSRIGGAASGTTPSTSPIPPKGKVKASKRPVAGSQLPAKKHAPHRPRALSCTEHITAASASIIDRSGFQRAQPARPSDNKVKNPLFVVQDK
jgi:hypothetical protein